MKTFLVAVVVILLGIIGWMWYSGRASQAPADTGQQTNTQSSTIIPNVPDVTYTNTKLSFSVMHPETATESEVNYDGYLPLTKTALVSFALPKDMFVGTNLGEAGVYIGATTTPDALTACSDGTALQGETKAGVETINGADFTVFTASDAGAGNFYESKIYRRLENGWCVEAVELLHSGNIANYPEGSVKEFDKPYFQSILEKIVHTYRSIPTGA